MAIPLPQDFKEFLQSFEEEKIDYLLFGGYAVSFYGYARATAGMDVWIAVNPMNAKKAVKALQRFGMNSPDLTVDLYPSGRKDHRDGRSTYADRDSDWDFWG
jgi:hypothetical protein